MKVSMQTADLTLQQKREEIERLTADYEAINGPVQTTAIITHSTKPMIWNGTLISDEHVQKGEKNSSINQKIHERYATEPCLTAFSKELGISINSLSKRAGRLGVTRDPKIKSSNNPTTVRAIRRLKQTEELLQAGKTVEQIAETLDISYRLACRYRQQIEETQEAA